MINSKKLEISINAKNDRHMGRLLYVHLCIRVFVYLYNNIILIILCIHIDDNSLEHLFGVYYVVSPVMVFEAIMYIIYR